MVLPAQGASHEEIECEDALAWHCLRIEAEPGKRRDVLDRVRRWHEENPTDVVGIIRQVREQEAS